MNELNRDARKSHGSLPERVAAVSVANHNAGDTLIEILVAISILGLIGVALLGAFASNLAGSAVYHNASAIEITLKNFAEAATAQIQYQADPTPLFQPCAQMTGTATNTTSGTTSQISYNGTALNFLPPLNFTVTASIVGYYNDTTGQFDSSVADCNARLSANPSLLDPQLIEISAQGPNGANGTLQFVVASLNHEKL